MWNKEKLSNDVVYLMRQKLTCVESPHGRLDPRGVIDGSTSDGAGGGVGLEEGASDVADPHGQEFLGGVHRLAIC